MTLLGILFNKNIGSGSEKRRHFAIPGQSCSSAWETDSEEYCKMPPVIGEHNTTTIKENLQLARRLGLSYYTPKLHYYLLFLQNISHYS